MRCKNKHIEMDMRTINMKVVVLMLISVRFVESTDDQDHCKDSTDDQDHCKDSTDDQDHCKNSLMRQVKCASRVAVNTGIVDEEEVHQKLPMGRFDVWLTTGDQTKKLSQEASIDANALPTSGWQVLVDPDQRYQTMDGFGAALTNAAAYNIYYSPRRSEIIQDLFGSSGIGISYIRLPMGGSDFQGVNPYTYNDIPDWEIDDVNLNYFSISQDRDFIIPVLLEALTVNPSLKIMATPWTAPAWMKNTDSLNGGDLIEEYMSTYAAYFVRFIVDYSLEGIGIDAITVQNEPLHESTAYPTMRSWWQQQSTFIRDHLGPAFVAAGLNTKILIYDHNWDDTGFAINLLNDQSTRLFVDGSAWHCYGGDHGSPDTVRNAHSDKDIYFTECSGGEWATDFASNLVWNTRLLFIGQPRVWAKTVLLWNLALDENHGPKVGVGGCSDCRGVITTLSSGNYNREFEYYVIGQFSKFIPSGSVRISSSNFGWDDIHTVAFSRPDGGYTVAVLNPSSSSVVDFHISLQGQTYQYNGLPPQSVVTLVMTPLIRFS